DMHGLSVSLLPLTPEFEAALKAPAAPPAWPGVRAHAKPTLRRLPKEIKATSFKASRNALLQGVVEAACDAMIAAESRLNGLDGKIGDGDTGSTIASAARHLKSQLSRLPLAEPADF